MARTPRQTPGLLDTLEEAATLLEREARYLRDCYIAKGPTGRWRGEDSAVRDEYALDACADLIRAGDRVDKAMAAFGLAWVPKPKSKRGS